jgi:selenocysteine lyase/cysteine desulfurase
MTVAYLDYAGLGRIPERARAAMAHAVNELLPGGAATMGPLMGARKQARAAAAALLDCGSDEVALVANTSAGIHLVADGLDWAAGDEVVLFDQEFPANVRPWLRLQARGVVVRWVAMKDGAYDLADLDAALSGRTRVVAAPHVHFRTGSRLDLDAVTERAHAAGALVCVDAVQSLGALPLSAAATPFDFLAAGAHKWLCAPPGTGLFFCRRDRLDLLRWAPTGWWGYDEASDLLLKGDGHLDYDLPLRPSARRLEGGMPDLLGILGLAHALEDLVEAGMDNVGRRVLARADRIRRGVAERGYLLELPEGAAQSGIVGFRHPFRPSAEVQAGLGERGVVVSFPDGTLRASPHHRTTDDELAALFDALPPV